MSTKVGVIGLGPMGGGYATLLLDKGFDVTGFDVDGKVMKELEAKGLTPAKDATEVAASGAEVLITSLPSLKAVEVSLEGIAKHDQKNQIVMECSTLAPDDKIRGAELLQKAGKILLDCPVSATPAMVLKGMCSIYVSGDKAAYEKALPVIEGFTASNFHFGKVGDASKMKLLANILVHVHNAVAAEAFTAGMKAGLDPQLMHDVLSKSAGSSKMLEMRGKMMVDNDMAEGGPTMFAVLQKDAKLITQFAQNMDCPIPLYQSALTMFYSAINEGFDHLDTSAVIKAYEKAAGVERGN